MQYAQELLSTFSTSLGEVALQPSTGGTFTVEIFHSPPPSSSSSSQQTPQPGAGPGEGIAPARTLLWDRKTDGGFPETKELKRRVRDVIEPGRDLGHVDRNHARPNAAAADPAAGPAATASELKTGTEGQQQQPQKARPSRTELEAAGPAGAGYPGSSEAAAEATAACESKRECEDCD
jgi:predicted Rdx family selenoprotein